jgi:polyisoprenoid-binding protein YceI
MSTDLSTTTSTWEIDPSHTTIAFHARHAMVAKVRGRFADFTGSFTLDGANPSASTAALTIMAASIDTKNPDRDGHLTSPEFLDVEQFPTITFTSTSVSQKSDSAFDITGDLTIHGVTKPVTINWELVGTTVDPWGGTRIGLDVRTSATRIVA